MIDQHKIVHTCEVRKVNTGTKERLRQVMVKVVENLNQSWVIKGYPRVRKVFIALFNISSKITEAARYAW